MESKGSCAIQIYLLSFFNGYSHFIRSIIKNLTRILKNISLKFGTKKLQYNPLNVGCTKSYFHITSGYFFFLSTKEKAVRRAPELKISSILYSRIPPKLKSWNAWLLLSNLFFTSLTINSINKLFI